MTLRGGADATSVIAGGVKLRRAVTLWWTIDARRTTNNRCGDFQTISVAGEWR
jgi:hypothetical protein